MEYKSVLILGGTGAMGIALVDILSKKKDIYVGVTSRRSRDDFENIHFIKGNALDDEFINTVLNTTCWDIIIDFMSYNTNQFSRRYIKMLNSCKQYIFISSCRVYAECEKAITEETHRLLDVSSDAEYLKTDEYALSKARQENLLLSSEIDNYTIVRPSITYNSNRLQLGVLEKEHWLYRALKGRTVVFSKDIADKLTSMAHGTDVSYAISELMGEEAALGEIFHITYPDSLTWRCILDIYMNVLEEITKKRPKVLLTDKSTCFKTDWNIYQIIYCRYFDRSFDNSKINNYVDVRTFTDMRTGIKRSLEKFLDNPEFQNINWKLEAINDRVSGEMTSLKEISNNKEKLEYLFYRFWCGWCWKILLRSKSMLRKLKKRMCNYVQK